MKLRIVPNVVRLRLGKSEVERLGQGGECRESIHFPGSQLEYVLNAYAGKTITASLTGTTIRIEVPSQQLTAWCSSNQVGLSGEVALPGQQPLEILIEKDFRCLDARPGEDQADTFENPLGEHANC